jgi:Protein of unknown function (DUF3313)
VCDAEFSKEKFMRAYDTSLWIGICLLLGACTTTPAEKGALSTYENLSEGKGMLAKRRAFSNPELVAGQSAIFIATVEFAQGLPELTPDEKAILASKISRTFCDRISNRFVLADAPGQGALEVRTTVTEIRRTNAAAATVSVVLPVRAPIGLGALGVEAEALTADRVQAAALIWRREADSLFSGSRMSSIGDAFNFAGDFGQAFGDTLRKDLPRLETPLARDGKRCDRFGKSSLAGNLVDMISPLSLPPAWEQQTPTAPSPKSQ